MAQDRSQQEYERDVTLAWHIANWSGPGKRLPDLTSVLARIRKPAKQSVEEQRAVLSTLSQLYKLPLRKTRLIRRDGKAV